MRLPHWFRLRRQAGDQATFCESCSQVCDAACRSAAVYERDRAQMLRFRAGMP